MTRYNPPLRAFLAAEKAVEADRWGWAVIIPTGDGSELIETGTVPDGAEFPDVLGFVLAALAAYRLLPSDHRAEIGTPKVVQTTLRVWVPRWENRGWMTKEGNPVAHAWEWDQLSSLELVNRGRIDICGVWGGAFRAERDRAAILAREAAAVVISEEACE